MFKFSVTISVLGVILSATTGSAIAADGNIGGKITSLKGSASSPAIRLEGNISPNLCDGGPYGWLYFAGTAQEKQWLYSTAMAMALTGNRVTVYTNTDGGVCHIHDIQITSGLN